LWLLEEVSGPLGFVFVRKIHIISMDRCISCITSLFSGHGLTGGTELFRRFVPLQMGLIGKLHYSAFCRLSFADCVRGEDGVVRTLDNLACLPNLNW
jgi:hypothetical protein